MTNDAKLTFPTIPAKHWWGLRDKFKRSLPPVVTTSYLETALNINKRSAETLLPPLKSMGIIDNDCRPGERAAKWREDDTYREVCTEIIQEVYPEELFHAIQNPISNRDAVERWFSRNTRAGEVVVSKYAALYQLLSEGDPSKSQDINKKSESKQEARQRTSTTRNNTGTPKRVVNRTTSNSDHSPESKTYQGTTEPIKPISSASPTPSIHIDIQIHISPEASSAQIDQIFASMAKHLYGRSIE